MEVEAGVSLKQVRLKVLYTFDADHKNNHLARWPRTLEVQSAQLDDTNIIGCVDLRTCLEAVTTASPELTSNTDNDFTVYAYDYSEPDTPLVGQGMLSKALPHEGSMDADNEAMITGRITKNVMGLFSKNAQETLEVKLRFTPVAGQGFRRRSGSISSNPDTVQSQWNSLVQSTEGLRPSSPMNISGLEAMHRMLNDAGRSRDRSNSVPRDTICNSNQMISRPSSRAGTPAQLQQTDTAPRQPAPQSRPASRSGIRAAGHGRRDSFNSGYYSGEDAMEEGPARKRARLQKVEHPSKSNLNIERQSDSLRVAASTASSVRLHRPVPLSLMAASLQNSVMGDDPVRPPTPLPATTKTGRPRGRPRKVVSANLLRGPKPRISLPVLNIHQIQAESSFSSPEDIRAESVTSTPADLPSSPPVMPEAQNLITSPQLPPLLDEVDSGFMSGCMEDFFGEEVQMLNFNDFLHEKPLDLQPVQPDMLDNGDINNLSTYQKDIILDVPTVFDEPVEAQQSASEMEPPPPPPPPPPRVSKAPMLAKANSFTSSHRPIVPAPRLAPALAPKITYPPENQRAYSVLPQIPASDPIGRTFHRSNTWAPDMSDAIMSDAVTNEEQAKAKPRKRVGKEQTKARLENAIASGEMPPFCDNCGAIETPAWRRAYAKVFECPWDEFETSLEPGECCYKEPIEHDADGNITKFKGYKSERGHDESCSEGWMQICLCNPCGLWFHKSKFPRPPEKWQKRDPNEKKKKKRGSKSRKRATAPKPTAKSDAPTPASDDSSPADTAAEGGDMDDNADSMTVNDDEANDDSEPQLPPMPRFVRGGSAEPANNHLKLNVKHGAEKYRRQVQSSPARAGNTRLSAIEINLTPKPLRRQLFPSPQSLQNKSDAAATMINLGDDNQVPTFVRRSPRLNKVRDVFATPMEAATLMAVNGLEKENVAPVVSHSDDGLDGLFDGAFDDMMPPPSTPKRRSERLLSKTPGKTPSREFGETMSPNVQRTPNVLRTPKNLLSVTSKFKKELPKNVNPIEMTPFSRSLHEALHCSNVESLEPAQTPRAGGNERLRKTPKKTMVKDSSNFFDFPDLPSLNGSSPMGVDLMQAFEFSEMTADHLHPDFHNTFSTDIPMPSSPPQGYFNVVNGKGESDDSIWPEINTQDEFYNGFDNGDMLHVCSNSGGVRRSPRKHAA